MSCGWVIQAGTDHAETTVFADEGLSDATSSTIAGCTPLASSRLPTSVDVVVDDHQWCWSASASHVSKIAPTAVSTGTSEVFSMVKVRSAGLCSCPHCLMPALWPRGPSRLFCHVAASKGHDGTVSPTYVFARAGTSIFTPR